MVRTSRPRQFGSTCASTRIHVARCAIRDTFLPRNPAFEWLNRACLERQGGCEGLKSDRFLRGLRDDPRHRALLSKMKLDGETLSSVQ